MAQLWCEGLQEESVTQGVGVTDRLQQCLGLTCCLDRCSVDALISCVCGRVGDVQVTACNTLTLTGCLIWHRGCASPHKRTLFWGVGWQHPTCNIRP